MAQPLFLKERVSGSDISGPYDLTFAGEIRLDDDALVYLEKARRDFLSVWVYVPEWGGWLHGIRSHERWAELKPATLPEGLEAPRG